MTTSPDGETIDGRYLLGPTIGRGAMAEVRSGADLRLGRTVAVKLLHAALAAQPEARLRFEEEARAAARLSDPNVVAVYDTGEHLGRPFIVMELLPGRTLHDELADGPMSERRAREVITHVLYALEAAHGAGVIHRDVKPANILLTATGEAKVADFGIAKVAESSDLTATGMLLGTPSYLAPECVTGHAATAATDVYAVGVVLYEALGGRRPFGGDSPLAVCHAICTDEPAPLGELRPQLSRQVVAVVARAMAKDPHDRYRTAAEMLHALGGDASPVPTSIDEPTQAIDVDPTLAAEAVQTQRLGVRPPAAPSPQRWTRAHAKALVAAAAVLVGIGLFFSLVDFGKHDAAPPTSTPTPTVTTVASAPATTPPTQPLPTTPSTKPKKGPKPGHGSGKPPKG